MAYSTYYYDGQIRRYLLQFVDLFSGLKVRTGFRADGKTPIDITVPIHYANLDRMVAYCLAGGSDSETTSQSLPIMSAYMNGITYAPLRAKSSAVVDRRTYITVEDNLSASSQAAATAKIKVKSRAMPVPYDLTLELNLLAENQDQHFQMLEQILMVFNPALDIQSNDSAWDWTALSTVTLQDVGLETAFPPGEAETIISSTLTFTMPIWISGPMKQDINRFVAGIRHIIRDASRVEGSLEDLVVPGLETGSIPAGITNDEVAIPPMGAGVTSVAGSRIGIGSTLNDLWRFGSSPLNPTASNAQIWVDASFAASEFIIVNSSNIEINASTGQSIELRNFFVASAAHPGATGGLVDSTEDELGLDSGHVFGSDINID
jgi:hypothetical protein